MSLELSPGQQLADYRVESRLGEGGQGVIYLVEHVHLHKRMALKLLHPEAAADPAFRERFLREARLAASLDHPNILDVYDAGEAGGELFIASRLVSGRDLAALIETEGPLSPQRALELLEPAANALDFAHEHGLVHRDVKPHNILIEPGEGEAGETVYLSDFGLTKRVDDQAAQAVTAQLSDADFGALETSPVLTQSGYFVGTPAYVAPEQLGAGALTKAADQYALTCVLFECLSGRPPYVRDSTVALLGAHLTEAPPRITEARPGLPAGLDEVIARGMAKDPSQRYVSCTALIEAVRTVLGVTERVFISYAREDQVFVRRLHEGLRARGRQTWVDWEGIPPSAEWMAEIRAAIDAADAFVFVISPDSLESGPCREELAYAETAHKRIVPVLHREVEGIPLPEGLSKRNWVFLRDADEFDQAVGTLMQAVETDLGWVRYHTRLQVRAREWEHKGRDRSLLLRGSDLNEAERALTAAAGKQPEPTPLQGEFVLASRRAAGRRQRTLFGAVAAALVVAIALAALAFFQRAAAVRAESAANAARLEAERQEAEAVRQAGIATSRLWAKVSVDQFDTDPERALLIAIEAVRRADTPEAREALVGAYARSYVRQRLHGHTDIVNSVGWSPDGTLVVTGSEDETARLWDAADGTELHVLGGGGATRDVAFSPDGSIVATAWEDGLVKLWDPATGEEVDRITIGPSSAGDLAFNEDGRLLLATATGVVTVIDVPAGEVILRPSDANSLTTPSFSADGRRIAIGTAGGEVHVVDVATGRTELRLTPGIAEPQVARFSPGGTLILVGGNGGVEAWEAETGRLHRRIPLPGTFLEAVFSPSGRRVATSMLPDAEQGTVISVQVWNVDSGEEIAALPPFENVVQGLEFDRLGRRLLTASFDGTATLWDIETAEPVFVLRGHTDSVPSASFSPDGSRVASASLDRTARIWDVSLIDPQPRLGSLPSFAATFLGDGSVVEGGPTPAIYDPSGRQVHALPVPESAVVSALDASPDGEVIVTGTITGEVHVFDSTGQPGPAIEGHPDIVWATAVAPDGTTFATGSEDGTARLWNVATGEQIGLIRHPGPVRTAAYSPDGTLLVTGGAAVGGSEGEVAVVSDARTGEPVATIAFNEREVLDVAFSPDGSRLALVGGDVDVRIYDTRTWDVASVLEGHTDVVWFAEFSSDGRRLITGGNDDSARIWDLDSGEVVVTLEGHEEPVRAGGFGVGGLSYMTGSEDGTIRLWDASGRTLRVLDGRREVIGLALSPDATRILASGFAPAALYDCDICASVEELVDLAPTRATRELTPAERARFLEGESPAA